MGAVSGSLDHLVYGSLQVVGFPPLGPDLFQLAPSVFPLVVLEGGDKLGIDPARHVFRSDPTDPALPIAPPDY
jgi:hypothetical protein